MGISDSSMLGPFTVKSVKMSALERIMEDEDYTNQMTLFVEMAENAASPGEILSNIGRMIDLLLNSMTK